MLSDKAHIEETELIQALKVGEETAYKRLFDHYSSMVYNTALNFHSIPEDAEETTQDVFIEIFRNISSFKGDSTLKTWIYRITITKALEKLRMLKRKKRWAFLISIDNENAAFLQNVSDTNTENETSERAMLLKQQIDKLSQNQKIAFTLHHIEGLSYTEITAIMDISLSSVESLIFRAKSNLKKKLSTYYSNKL